MLYTCTMQFTHMHTYIYILLMQVCINAVRRSSEVYKFGMPDVFAYVHQSLSNKVNK